MSANKKGEAATASTSTQQQKSMAENEGQKDYEVGYKRPPAATQFKKGSSGNPKGSKKKEEVDDIRVVMEDVLSELIKVREGDKQRVVSREEAIMRAELKNALNGDPRAIEALFKRAQKCRLFTKAKSQSLIVITEEKGDDGKILRMLAAVQEALRKAAEGLNAARRNNTPSSKRL